MVGGGRLTDWISLGVLASWVPADAVDDTVPIIDVTIHRRDQEMLHAGFGVLVDLSTQRTKIHAVPLRTHRDRERRVWPGLAQSVIAANSFIVATKPLAASVSASILPGREVASDSRRLLLYFRRDSEGHIRVIAFQPSFERLVERTFDTIRQAAIGMPAIMIRQLDAIAKVIEQVPDRQRRTALIRQAEAIQRSNLATVPDSGDRDDVTQRYEAVLALVTPVAAEPKELRLA